MSGATTGDELYQRHTMLVFSASACLFPRENGGLCGRFVLDDEMTGKAVALGSPIRRAPDWYESRWRFDTDDAATGWLDASVGADGTEVSYTRRNGGGVAAVSSVAGTTSYSYDMADRLSSVSSPAGSFGFGYCGWNGMLASATNASGLVTEYAYDTMDRVTNISWCTSGGASLGGFAYEYDAVGRIVSRSHALGTNAFDRAYAYDGLDRLASDGGVTYTYDEAGNRMTRTENGEPTTYTLGAGDRLASWTGGSYAYNTAGCVTRIERAGRPTFDLTWNGQYQLVSISTNGVFAEGYAYDALGRRVSTTTQEGTVRHVYDDSWQCLADIDENGNVICSYVWGEGIDKLLAVKIGGESYYPLIDIQGTVWGYADSANNVAARWTYDAWGNVLSVFCTVSSLASVRYRFQGREWSHATCLMNFRMRWYDSNTGRWLSKDPIRLNGGLNLYAFCLDFPLQNTDYNGCNPLLLSIAWPVLMETSIKLATFAGFAYEGWQLFARYRKSCSGSGYSGGSGYKGERGRTARPDGTRNPGKKFRQNKDGRWEYQDSNGIWHKNHRDSSLFGRLTFNECRGRTFSLALPR